MHQVSELSSFHINRGFLKKTFSLSSSFSESDYSAVAVADEDYYTDLLAQSMGDFDEDLYLERLNRLKKVSGA